MPPVIPGSVTASSLRRETQLWKTWDSQVSIRAPSKDMHHMYPTESPCHVGSKGGASLNYVLDNWRALSGRME